jgi:survival-of-motor-neuron-related-splicing factor 30
MSSSVAELNSQLSEYREQLTAIDSSLFAEPDNADLRAAQAQLLEVIALTEELLAEARAHQIALVKAAQAAAASFVSAATAASAAAAGLSNASFPILNVVSSSSSAATQQPPSLQHHHLSAVNASPPPPPPPPPLAEIVPGTVCKAIWRGEQKLFRATIKRTLPNGQVVIVYDGYTDEVTVPRDQITVDLSAATADEAGLTTSKKRKAETEDPYAEQPIPASLTILPSDSAEEKERKKKRIKAIKSANRLKRNAKEKAESANSWQKFISKKASTKAVSGFSTGKKTKKSMFATPDTVDGKVGVTNSGNGITESGDRKKFRIRGGEDAQAGAADDDDDDDDSESGDQ